MSEFMLYLQIGLNHVLDIRAYDHILFLTALVVPYSFKDWKKTIESFPKVATFDRKIIDNALEKGQTEKGKSKVNYGHALEHILFNTSFTEILSSQSEVDGIYNGKKVQVKASLVTWNKVTGKNNSASIATVCEMNKALFE